MSTSDHDKDEPVKPGEPSDQEQRAGKASNNLSVEGGKAVQDEQQRHIRERNEFLNRWAERLKGRAAEFEQRERDLSERERRLRADASRLPLKSAGVTPDEGVNTVSRAASEVGKRAEGVAAYKASDTAAGASRSARRWPWVAVAAMVVTMLGWVYWALWASPRYTAVASFHIQAERQVPSDSILGVIGLNSGVSDDNRIAMAYLSGRGLLGWLDEQQDLRAHWSDRRWDWFSRLDVDAGSEDFYDYARDRMEVVLDQTSGLVQLRVQAFTPEFAEIVAGAMLERAEEVVNQLGHHPVRERLRFLEGEVEHQQARLEQAKSAILSFQAAHGVIDPTSEIIAGAQGIAALQAQLAQERAALASLRVVQSERSLAVRQAEARIGGVEQQIADERARLIAVEGDDEGVTDIAAKYQSLTLDLSLRIETHSAALLAYQQARAELGHKLKHLLVVEPPAVADEPTHPRTWYNTLTLLVVSVLVAGTGALIVATVAEHKD